MTVQSAQERLASSIVSNARIKAAHLIEAAEARADDIVRAAHGRANRIEESARQYAAKQNPDRPCIDRELYQQLLRERYGIRKTK